MRASTSVLLVTEESGFSVSFQRRLAEYQCLVSECTFDQAAGFTRKLLPDIVVLHVPDENERSDKDWSNSVSALRTAAKGIRVVAVIGAVAEDARLSRLCDRWARTDVRFGEGLPNLIMSSVVAPNYVSFLNRPGGAKEIALLELAAKSDAAVLLSGETGTGKELAAHHVHESSTRRREKFVPLFIAGQPESLVEDALWGHMRGAYTGAISDRKGAFEFAHRGTLFLDEIGELKLALQTKLLRVLDHGEVTPIGAEKNRIVDVRVVAATNRNLAQMVADREFRQDLYYRLNGMVVELSPLREHPDDIEFLARRLVQSVSAGAKQLTDGAVELLKRHSWPGNVREMISVVEWGVALSSTALVDVCDLQEKLRTAPGPKGLDGLFHMPYRDALQEFNRRYFTRLLERNGYNVSRAADEAGMFRANLYGKLHTLGIKVQRSA